MDLVPLIEGEPTQIDCSERERRAVAINNARGSVRLEGFILSPEAEELFARYIEGELTRPQLNTAVLKLAGIHTENSL